MQRPPSNSLAPLALALALLIPGRAPEAAAGFDGGPSAHATYRSAPIALRALEVYNALESADREAAAGALSTGLLAAGDLDRAFAVSMDAPTWDDRLASWSSMLDSLRASGRFGEARRLVERVTTFEEQLRRAERLDPFAELLHAGFSCTGQLEAARQLVARLRPELSQATLLSLHEAAAVHHCALGDALFGSELTAAKRLDALTKFPGAEDLAAHIQLALCARAFREGDTRRGASRFDLLSPSTLVEGDPLTVEVQLGRVLSDLEAGRVEPALERAGRFAKSAGSNQALLLIQQHAFESDDLALAQRVSELASRRDENGWRQAILRTACAEIRADQLLEGGERLATLGTLGAEEALFAAAAYHHRGQPAPLEQLAGDDASLRNAIAARELRLEGAREDREAFVARIDELSAAMPTGTVFPRIELLEVLAELREPKLGLRELEWVLGAALEQPGLEPGLRARALEFDTRLRGGFGVQRQIERLGPTPQSMSFLIDALGASLSEPSAFGS